MAPRGLADESRALSCYNRKSTIWGMAGLAFEPNTFGSEPFCYLTTTGRLTGQPRTIEIWFALSDGTLYMLSGNRDGADWVKNALRQPRVTIKIRESSFDARARMMKDNSEDALARRLLYEKYSPSEEWARTSLPLAFDLMTAAH
jgi:deazaflavin-dependent oxidoreductase (nitroreductase family)